jgi:hypothetical protein
MKSVAKFAQRLLQADEDLLEELRLHEFQDEESAADDDLRAALYLEFDQEFNHNLAELTKQFGTPQRVGTDDDDALPVTGVLRFALWQIDEKLLFLATSHEDREVPVILWLGTSCE